MEQSGDVYDAGCLAAELEQWDRAIHNLQKVESRHPRYIETCRKLAEILIEKGESALAIEKFDQAISLTGTTDASLDLLADYGSLLERADRAQEALAIYEGIRVRDLHYDDVNARIEGLRKVLSQPGAGESATALDTDSAATVVSVGPAAVSKAKAVESRYEIIDELGRGGMGVVYKARDLHLQRVVALKVLSEHLRQHQSALDLFLREARSAAALNHRNIVIVYDAGQEGNMDFISMEHLEGSGLDTIQKQRGALNAKTVASVGLQVAAGLDYAQRNKIIHRDIKPSNLFITRDKVVKILDFGLAKMVEEVRRSSTVIGGTPNYMAPEQAIGNPTDHRTDLYALGATLFHLVTGTVPFETGDVTYHHAHTPAPDPRERELSVPDDMAELILKLMCKEPEERCESAREVAIVLQKILKS
jgi:serine/threonine-protein kinase